MNDGSTDLKKFSDIKHFSLRLNKTRVTNDVTTAMKTFRAERRYSIVFDIEYSIGRQTGSL